MSPVGIQQINALPEFDKLVDYLSYYATSRPESEAMVLDRQRISYREFADLVDRSARSLHARGIRKGDRVATLSTPRPEFYISLLATVKIGGIWVGLNPRHHIDELRYVLTDSRAQILFALPRFEGRDFVPDLRTLAREVPKGIVTFGEGLDGLSVDFEDFQREPEGAAKDFQAMCERVKGHDPAIVVYTSGSTGKPKGAVITHRGFILAYRTQYEHWGTVPMRILNNLPINHIGCAGDICSYALICGGTTIFLERFNAANALKLIERERISTLLGVPTMYLLMVELPDFLQHDLSSLQVIIWGGAAAPKELILKLRSSCSARLYNCYGLTESVAAVTYTDDDASVEVLAETVGRPERRFGFRIVDANGREVEVGTPGEICIRGDIVTPGYLNQPEASAEAIDEEGWLRTGDIGLQRPDGNIHFIGRIKEMFKSGGYNVYPREVEIVIESHPSVAMAAIVSVPDPLYSEVGHAFVIARQGFAVNEDELRAYCRERLGNYKVPKRFVLLNELPMLPVGKIDKQALKKIALQEIAGV
jgi:acyl-CoA synthetase (AMP-forming)/AMP-acid ligase II